MPESGRCRVKKAVCMIAGVVYQHRAASCGTTATKVRPRRAGIHAASGKHRLLSGLRLDCLSPGSQNNTPCRSFERREWNLTSLS